MQTYGTKELQRLLGVSAGTVRSAVRAGYVAPRRDRRGALRFTFHDLIIVRTASTLSAAKVPAKRVAQSMRALRRQLPKQAPLSGLAIVAVGDRIAVREGAQRWDTSSGQYLLALDVQVEQGELRIIEAHLGKQAQTQIAQAEHCEARFEAALALEGHDTERALEVYRECIATGVVHIGAYINSGRLLHELGRLDEAESLYKRALREHEDATLCFNLAVLLEDQGRDEEAIAAYDQSLRLDHSLADAHYNLARLHEAAGNDKECLRHLSAYRRQQS
jgi:tetratricopeptide (TPR) repeat protein